MSSGAHSDIRNCALVTGDRNINVLLSVLDQRGIVNGNTETLCCEYYPVVLSPEIHFTVNSLLQAFFPVFPILKVLVLLQKARRRV